MIKTIPAQDYKIHLGHHVHGDLATYLPAELQNHAFVIVTDNTVKKLYAKPLIDALASKGYCVDLISIPAGEKSKTRETKARIESYLLKKNYGRDTCLIALGGGVIGDLTGFVAATYLRGIPYIQVPTTLLAMVDSSVGGKTAINTPEGKNLIGAFWNPSLVLADLACLSTLPEKHRINGWIEALKIFMLRDFPLFKKARQAPAPTLDFIHKAIAYKVEIVARDPLDQGLRAILNVGHTVGHALEKVSEYKLLHGVAVGHGILIESHIALQRGLIKPSDFHLIVEAMRDLSISGKSLKKFPVQSILAAMQQDKKRKAQILRMALLGKDQLPQAVSEQEIQSAFHAITEGVPYVR